MGTSQWQHVQYNTHRIGFRIMPGLVQVDNRSGELSRTMSWRRRQSAVDISNLLRQQYRRATDSELAITDHSLAIELWIHAILDTATRMARRLRPLRPTADAIIRRTEVIDMGEADIDSNRFIWDVLARLTGWAMPGPRSTGA